VHKLVLDGKEVPASRIGFTRADPTTGQTLFSYIGLDFGERGTHVLHLTATDPMGNVRVDQRFTLTRTGEIDSVHLISAEGNVADGKTPVRVRLELRDDAGRPLRAATKLQLGDANLEPVKRLDDNVSLDAKAEERVIPIDKDGWVTFRPVSTSGAYHAVIKFGRATVKVETYVEPELRKWILVGLAEGTAGYNKVSGNLETLGAHDVGEQFYERGRVAFYAKGRIKGKWLLTTSFDSDRGRRDTDARLFQIIDPDAYYTLYGDASQQAHDAASTRKLYVKIERAQYYALFGDFDTGLSVTELSRYDRRLNGVKTELQTRNVEVNAFGSQFESRFTRDELPGDGTSGLYRLSHREISFNTETITIETRDRFRSERVLSAQPLTRFLDYSIDYEAGTIFFKEPIQSRDEQLNPITIVVEYETLATGKNDYTYGGRAGFKLLDRRLRVGGTYVHEGQGVKRNNLYGGDLRLELGRGTTVSAELATTDSAIAGRSVEGNAYLAELAHTTTRLDARLGFRQQDPGFGLGQLAATETGTRKLGLDATYRLNERLSTIGRAYRQETLVADNVSDVADVRLDYKTPRAGGYVGARVASDELGDGTTHTSDQVFIGGTLRFLKRKLGLTAEHAQSLIHNDNAAFPTRSMVSAEYQLTEKLTLVAAQELTWGAVDTAHTRLGVRSTPWKGATVTNSVDGQMNENDLRVFGNTGIKQTFDLTSKWRLDAGRERTQTFEGADAYQVNPAAPPVSGAREDFTAAFGGASYRERSFVWETRVEGRISGAEDKWGVLSGIVAELGSGWAWSGRGQLFQTDAFGGAASSRANLRLGLVFRPASTKWIFLDRLDLVGERVRSEGAFLGGTPSGAAGGTLATGDRDELKVIENLSANYRPGKRFQLSVGAGVKYARELLSDTRAVEVTDRLSLEPRVDLTPRWDVGMAASMLHAWRAGTTQFAASPSVGYNVTDNAWISLGYNLFGTDDADFAGAGYVAHGPFVRLRLKFDQDSVKAAAGWLNLQ
jgi:hypothetical protein